MDSQFNRFELEAFARSAADAFHDGGVELNDTITKQAQENGFTGHHVSRVVENANILVNGELVKSARSSGRDPRVAFALADGPEIMRRVSGDVEHDKVASQRRDAEVIDLFTVEKAAGMDATAIVDGVLGAEAADPYADHAVSRDPMVMAQEFVKNATAASEAAVGTDAATLGRVSATLDGMHERARGDHEIAKVAMDEAENDLVSEICAQILGEGLRPATVRDVIKSADLDARVAEACDRLVTKAAGLCDVREGKSQFTPGSVVNAEHVLITKAASVMDKVAAAVVAGRGAERFAGASREARGHYARAVREGR